MATSNLVKFGVNEVRLNFVGCKASDVAAQCMNILSLEGEERMKVNGTECDENYIVKEGDYIEFVKEAGTKGNDITVSVQNGVNRVDVRIEDGATVSQVIRDCAAILGIDMGTASNVVVNGMNANPETQVHSGDRVEFRKDAGTKGC